MRTASSRRSTTVAASWADAYAAQDEWLASQARAGIAPCGVKLATLPDGDRPVTVTGWLTSEMRLNNGACLPAALRGCSVEVEVAARLGAGGIPVTRQDAIGMIASLHVAFEFVATSPTLVEIGAQQFVARNVNARAFVVAEPGLGAEQGLLELTSSDARVTAPGRHLDWVGGTPPDVVAAVMEAGDSLARRGHRLQPGWWILTGRVGAKLDLAEVTGLTATLGRFGSVTAMWDMSRSGT